MSNERLAREEAMAKFKCTTFVLALALLAVATTAQQPKERIDFRRYIAIRAPIFTPSGITPELKGTFEIYSLYPDGSFTFGQDNESTPREHGTYQVRGNQVIFRTGSSEVVGERSSDGRSIMIKGNTYERSK
jgi:hypothetical protein